MIRLIAMFRPQVWVDDYTEEVPGRVDFDVTDKILALSFEDLKGFEENNYDSDHLADGLPEREAHDGPFEVDTDIDSWLSELGFDVGREELTQTQFDELHKLFEPTVS